MARGAGRGGAGRVAQAVVAQRLPPPQEILPSTGTAHTHTHTVWSSKPRWSWEGERTHTHARSAQCTIYGSLGRSAGMSGTEEEEGRRRMAGITSTVAPPLVWP